MRIHPAALIIPALLLPACSTTGIGGHSDGHAEDTAVDPDASDGCPGHDPDRERGGGCFHWHGLPGAWPDRAFPMRVDLGAISVGQSVEGGLMFQYFCWEWEGETRVVGAFIQDTSEYENSPDYSFSTNPGPCEVVTEVHNYLFWEVTPGEPGFHRCAAWFEAEYGYYDFEFVIEAYEPSDEPVQLVTDCLEPPEVLNIDIPMDRVYLYQPLVFRATCSLSYGREHLVVTRVDIEGDEDGVFELGDWPVSGRGFSPLSPGDDCYVIHIGFFPTAPGTFWAEAIIHTNEPAGEHRVLLVGISRG